MKSLVCSAGSAKMAFGCGVIKHLLGDLKNDYSLYCGTSAGALNASFLAQFKSGQEKEASEKLTDLWKRLDKSQIYRRWWPFGRLSFWKPSIYDSAPLLSLIKKNINSELIKTSGKHLRISAVSLVTGKSRIFDENYHDIHRALAASAAYSGIFTPLKMQNEAGEYELYTDGGLRSYCSIRDAIKSGATEIDVIMTNPTGLKHEPKHDHSLFSLGLRVVEIAHDFIIENDILQTIKINNIIKNGGNIPGKKYIDLKIIRPEEDLNVSPLDFSQKSISSLIDLGYKTAINTYFENR